MGAGGIINLAGRSCSAAMGRRSRSCLYIIGESWEGQLGELEILVMRASFLLLGAQCDYS